PSNRSCVASTKRSKLSLLAGEAFLVSAPAPAITQPNSVSETASLSAKTAALASLVCRAISRSAGTGNCRASPPPRSCLTRQAGKWSIVFHVAVDVVERAGADSVGIDFGLTSLIALSNGETEKRPNWTKRAAKELRRRQRAVARCKRGSNTRKKRKAALARFHAHVANRRRHHL